MQLCSKQPAVSTHISFFFFFARASDGRSDARARGTTTRYVPTRRASGAEGSHGHRRYGFPSLPLSRCTEPPGRRQC